MTRTSCGGGRQREISERPRASLGRRERGDRQQQRQTQLDGCGTGSGDQGPDRARLDLGRELREAGRAPAAEQGIGHAAAREDRQQRGAREERGRHPTFAPFRAPEEKRAGRHDGDPPDQEERRFDQRKQPGTDREQRHVAAP